LKARMKLVLELLNRKREILKLSNKIDSAVKGELSKKQREDYLRQQLKAIKEELGETPPTPKACSFCGKAESEVKKLIAAAAVAICDECIVRFSGRL